MGTDPAAIGAQMTYLRQILEHVNPYTRVALKDEPAILFIELVNEPWHHPEDVEGSIRYINALADAVRSTGCTKLIFYNVSQDFRIGEAIRRSRAQGITFGWYPTGLNSGHELVGNYLRAADAYPDMLRPELVRLPRIVYEFDSPDLRGGTMYPAMARTFRAVGAQFAAMFAYDMLETASRNLGWQTHYLSLAYTPDKVVTRAISRAWLMTLTLPDLGTSFTVQPIAAGNQRTERAAAGAFMVTPGVYLLSAAGPVDVATLPPYVGAVATPEYHAPPLDTLPPSVQSLAASECVAGRDVQLRARVVDRTPPDSAKLFIRPAAGGVYRGFTMHATGGYVYSATVSAAALHESGGAGGPHQYVVTLFRGDSVLPSPDRLPKQPTDWDYYGRSSWRIDVVDPQTPLRLFSPAEDAAQLAFTRLGDAGRRGLFRLAFSAVTRHPVFHFELPVSASGAAPADYTASLVIKDRVEARRETITRATELRMRLRGLGPRQVLHLTLMEDDGTSWSAVLPVDSTWSERTIPLAALTLDRKSTRLNSSHSQISY